MCVFRTSMKNARSLTMEPVNNTDNQVNVLLIKKNHVIVTYFIGFNINCEIATKFIPKSVHNHSSDTSCGFDI